MTRLRRLVIPSFPHHIIQRGNRRQTVFFCDRDRNYYLKLIRTFAARERVAINAYCLMDNHVHIIATPKTEQGLARCFGEAHRRYTITINEANGWRGYLWEGRFKSYVLDGPYFLRTARYIERNPIEAGLVARAEEYYWSSARAHVLKIDDQTISSPTPFIECGPGWGNFVNTPSDKELIRRLAHSERTGRPLGDDSFITFIEQKFGITLTKQKPGPKN